MIDWYFSMFEVIINNTLNGGPEKIIPWMKVSLFVATFACIIPMTKIKIKNSIRYSLTEKILVSLGFSVVCFMAALLLYYGAVIIWAFSPILLTIFICQIVSWVKEWRLKEKI